MTNSDYNAEFEVLLNYIRESRGFDFTGYKRSSLMRRVTKRMQTIKIEHYQDYLNYLKVHPEEFMDLFNTLLINVTSFFRDRAAWDHLISEVLPIIVSRRGPKEPIRLWSAGCASGEEVYTLAMALAETIGLEPFSQRVKIYATDVDEEALDYARQASYPATNVTDVPPKLLERYFEKIEERYVFRKDLRRSVIFGRHDLIQDVPISKVDLLVCRNTLMYFNSETQSQILTRFHFALRNEGFLFLGKAEMLSTHINTFATVNLSSRIFTKISTAVLRDRLITSTALHTLVNSTASSNVRLREAAFDQSPVAQLAVDMNGRLVFANERARSLFSIASASLGHPLQDFELSYQPIELRSLVNQVNRERRSISVREVSWQTSESNMLHFDVQIVPLTDTTGHPIGTRIDFIDITKYKRLKEELEHSNQQLEVAYEELQSVNKELQTVSDELQRRSEKLDDSNTFLASILMSLQGGVVVVNRDLQVQIWNGRSRDLWGLRTTEALGKNFLHLDIGLPVKQLYSAIHSCLSGNANEGIVVALQAINRWEKPICCRISCSPLLNLEQEIQGVIMVMEAQPDANDE